MYKLERSVFSILHRITVVGAGYVGLSIATMLSIRNKVTVLDIDCKKIRNYSEHLLSKDKIRGA